MGGMASSERYTCASVRVEDAKLKVLGTDPALGGVLFREWFTPR
jgi:hypothetical protein